MRKYLIILVILFSGCSDRVNEEEIMNSSISELYMNDQSDRQSNDLKWTVIAKRDELRRKRANQLLDSNKINSADDYYKTAMIFQHGIESSDYLKAVELMKKAIKIDSTINKFLFAAATDRYLLSVDKAQIYGTQYLQEKNGVWELKNYDTTAVSNAERIKYGVGTLNEQLKKLDEMNKEN